MKLIDLSAEFVKNLNTILKGVDLNNPNVIEEVRLLVRRIITIRDKLSDSESKLVSLIQKVENRFEKKENDVYYINQNGILKGILSRNIHNIKPKPVKKQNINCNCVSFTSEVYENIKKYVIIDSESLLYEVDSKLTQVILAVFDHDYRSFEGFVCWITILTPEGIMYIIDGLAFRDFIPRLKLLTCDVKKIIYCRECVERLYQDFGSIGCYKNFNITKNDIYVDWRIRPINDVFIGIMKEYMKNSLSLINNGFHTEKYLPENKNITDEFIKKYNLKKDAPFLLELINLRTYIAQTYDESIKFVMSDDQLFKIFTAKPSTIREFDALFDRMSSPTRLHAGDFLLIFRRKKNTYDIEEFK